jgi:hypothetical protein
MTTPQPRYTLAETADGVAVTIPFPAKPSVAKFLAGHVLTFVVLIVAVGLAMLIGPAGWIAVVVIVPILAIKLLFAWIGHRFKREVICVSPQAIRLELRGLLSRYVIRFPMEDIRNLRVLIGGDEYYAVPKFAARYAVALLQPTLAFDYGPQTIRFALGLEPWEAQELYQELARRYPNITA